MVVHDINMSEMVFALGLQDHMVGVTGISGWYKTSVSFNKLLGDIPMSDMGKLEIEIDDRSRQEAKKLTSLIDFQRSVFLLDEQDKRLTAMREE